MSTVFGRNSALIAGRARAGVLLRAFEANLVALCSSAGRARARRGFPAIAVVAALLTVIVACGGETSDSSAPLGSSDQRVAAAPSATVEQPPTPPTPVPATPETVVTVKSESNTPPAAVDDAEPKPDTIVAPTDTAGPRPNSPAAPPATAKSESNPSPTDAAPTSTATATSVLATGSKTVLESTVDTPVLVNTPGPVTMLAPDFTLPSIGGGEYTLSDYRGKQPVLVVFYRAYW